ncbi:hypothetical protein ACFWOJ_24360 [Streptomyces sp. NPDC058439]
MAPSPNARRIDVIQGAGRGSGSRERTSRSAGDMGSLMTLINRGCRRA